MELSDKSPVLRFSWQSSAFSGGGTIATSASAAPKANSLVACNMNVLIIKLGAAGDVVRTTTLLRRLGGQITWLTEEKNTVLLEGVKEGLKCVSWEQRDQTKGTLYDLVINLEDTQEIGSFLKLLKYKQLFGAYLDSGNSLRYTDDSRPWFDLGILSRYGKQQADQLNRPESAYLSGIDLRRFRMAVRRRTLLFT